MLTEIQEQPQIQTPSELVPIMLEITEEDRQNAGPYNDCFTKRCLIHTVLTRMGYSYISVGSRGVTINGRRYSSNDIGPEQLHWGPDPCEWNFGSYGQEVTGKQIILYPK